MAKASQKKTSMIQDAKAKHVRFSKRRSGIFKKASELCTLCAVEMAIIIFSPGGKPYSFGHSSPDAIIRKFTDSANSNAPAAMTEDKKVRSQQEAMAGDLYKRYSDLHAELKEKNERGKALKRMMMNFAEMDKMNRDELLEFKASLEDLKRKVEDRKEKLLTDKSVDLTLTLGGIYSVGSDAASSVKYRSTGLNSSANAHKGIISSQSLVPK